MTRLRNVWKKNVLNGSLLMCNKTRISRPKRNIQTIQYYVCKIIGWIKRKKLSNFVRYRNKPKRRKIVLRGFAANEYHLFFTGHIIYMYIHRYPRAKSYTRLPIKISKILHTVPNVLENMQSNRFFFLPLPDGSYLYNIIYMVIISIFLQAYVYTRGQWDWESPC